MIKHLRYLKYVLRHKWWVFVAGRKLGVPTYLLILHDWTKFLPSEWTPYVVQFYSSTKPQEDNPQFRRACHLHYRRNKHHWQYWASHDGYPFYIPPKYLAEMVADWAGAGKAITGRWELAEWYSRNKASIILSPHDRRQVERLINSFSEAIYNEI